MFPEREETMVLVVEDDPNALAGYLEFLTAAGFVAVGQPDGAAALEFARETVPDVVLTDISMPGLDGFALAAALRMNERTRAVPVVGMTGMWNAEMQTDAVAAGLSAMIAKPCMPSHLVAEIDRVVRRARLMAAVLNAVDNRPLRTVAPLPAAGLRNAVLRRSDST
jgi:DNA-binding response OmpR family regulator